MIARNQLDYYNRDFCFVFCFLFFDLFFGLVSRAKQEAKSKPKIEKLRCCINCAGKGGKKENLMIFFFKRQQNLRLPPSDGFMSK